MVVHSCLHCGAAVLGSAWLLGVEGGVGDQGDDIPDGGAAASGCSVGTGSKETAGCCPKVAPAAWSSKGIGPCDKTGSPVGSLTSIWRTDSNICWITTSLEARRASISIWLSGSTASTIDQLLVEVPATEPAGTANSAVAGTMAVGHPAVTLASPSPSAGRVAGAKVTVEELQEEDAGEDEELAAKGAGVLIDGGAALGPVQLSKEDKVGGATPSSDEATVAGGGSRPVGGGTRLKLPL